MYIELIELYKALLEDAIQDKRVLLDSGEYAGLLILLKEEDIEPLKALFARYEALTPGWGSIIYLDKEKRTRMFLSNEYHDKRFRFSVYVSDFPTYGAVAPEWRENVDKFIHYLNGLTD